MAPAAVFVEDNFSMEHSREMVSGWFKHILICTLYFYFYYYYISFTSDHQAIDPRGWEPLRGVCMLSHFYRVWLFMTLWTLALPSSSVHGILQARTLEWVTMPSPGNLLNPEIEPTSLMSPALAGGFFTTRTTWEGKCYFCVTDEEMEAQGG